MSSRKFLKYYSELSKEAQKRYMEKMNKTGPMSDVHNECGDEHSTSGRVSRYLQLFGQYSKSIHQGRSEGIQEPGWIQVSSCWLGGNVSSFQVSGLQHFMVWAKVRHSQTVSAQPANPWIAAKSGGPVIATHCDCIAGLSVVCSNISALLFTIEAHTNFIKETSCTSQPCQWIQPTIKTVKYPPMSEIDFSTPGTKRKKSSSQDVSTPTLSNVTSVAAQTDSEWSSSFMLYPGVMRSQLYCPSSQATAKSS